MICVIHYSGLFLNTHQPQMITAGVSEAGCRGYLQHICRDSIKTTLGYQQNDEDPRPP